MLDSSEPLCLSHFSLPCHKDKVRLASLTLGLERACQDGSQAWIKVMYKVK